MKSIFYIYLSVLLGIVFICGCTKDIKEVGETPGLDTMPVYPKGSSAFDTKAALKAMEEKKKAEEQAEEQGKAGFAEEIKKRLEGRPAPTVTWDPWISPAIRPLSDLPPAIRGFPKDKFGYPDWVATAKQGIVKPRGSISINEEAPASEVFDEDILFEINDRLMANVIFPHKAHNFWLSCKICHPGIFIAKRGANQFGMYDNWNGKFCGRCHGKVSFQMKGFENCQRCHRSPKKTLGIK
ncbi:MAG: c(7)-type cytochrome triheme domain-containing protein [Deltaproteobacteria bacterium]